MDFLCLVMFTVLNAQAIPGISKTQMVKIWNQVIFHPIEVWKCLGESAVKSSLLVCSTEFHTMRVNKQSPQ